MRLIALSDLHIGFRQYQRQTPDGINQREADVANVFRAVIGRIIEIEPDVIVIAGDIFHTVRPSNPAILHAFTQFSRLTRALPNCIVVMVAGNHDSPRAAETGCLLRLFAPLGIHVVEREAKRLAFPERGLSVLCVPDTGVAQRTALDHDPHEARNVLVLHGEVAGLIPTGGDRTAVEISPDVIAAPLWSYVALGHYHVYAPLGSNGGYSGSIEYTSTNPWGELMEERAAGVAGKVFVEYDLDTGVRTLHPITPARALVDLPRIEGHGMTAAEIDAAIRAHVAAVPGGIDDKIVRQVVRDVPRHVASEIDQRRLRDYKQRALHFHLDARRPEIVQRATNGPVAGRRASLAELMETHIAARPILGDIDRPRLTALGLHYLAEAAQQEGRESLAPDAQTTEAAA